MAVYVVTLARAIMRANAPAPPISTAPIAEPIAITPSLVARLASPADDLKHYLLPGVRRANGNHSGNDRRCHLWDRA